ncbi:restriction endonuclease subunit S [uncultured Brachyspira sp.]|uniref:restriction endonuclease subunit S n=1 Tax=uncultured Brachyspira sp. TaxID=221953 RepID=UPI002596B476|nr:restriction endonuclease subunit S [uncultured Brachyspira sp.]
MNKINKDWKEVKLGDIGVFLRGFGISKKDLSDSGTPAIRYGDIYTKYDFIIKNISSFTNSKGTELKKGDILFTGSGETIAEIGKSVAFIDDFKALAGGDIIIFRPSIELDSAFLSYMLNTGKCRRDISVMGQGVIIAHISSKSLQKLSVFLPSLDEQKRIASALSKIDAYLENTIKLIEEKERFKRGIAKKLLTCKEDENIPEARFKGFEDEWETKTLENICKNIKTGKLNANAMEKDGQYRFYTCAKDYYKINTYAFDGEAILISGNGAHVGYVHYYNGKFNAYQRTYVLMDFTENILFIKYYIDIHLKYKINIENNKGNIPYIVLNTIKDMEIKFPSLEEQEKIGGYLSLLDKEIDNLKKQKELIKEMKRGAMQKLLSGEVRLLE